MRFLAGSALIGALSLCAGAALGQIRQDTTAPPAPPAESAQAPVDIEAEALVAPARPEVPAALEAEVARLRTVVRATSECYTADGRMEHEADPACPRWYAQLSRGGAAGVFAIATLLEGDATSRDEEPDTLRTFIAEEQRGPRLMQIMAASQRPEAVPLVLRFVVGGLADPEARYVTDSEGAAWQSLEQLTGNNPAPRAPWQTRPSATLSSQAYTARAWLRWYRLHQHETREQWLRAGEQAAAEGLTSEDPAVRYWAIERLARVPEARPAVQSAFAALYASPDLPARGRAHLTRLGRRLRLQIPRVDPASVASATPTAQ